MFIGHFASALVARGLTEEAPKLGTLFVAAQLVDIAFFTFVILGVEHMRIVPGITAMNPMDLYSMPFTHSLLASAWWALAMAGFLMLKRRNAVAALWAGIVVLSHWVLDLLVHRPDLTLLGTPPKLGLGLWNYPLIEMPLEIGITLLAFWFYMRRTRGPVGPPLILLFVMFVLQAINWFAPEPTAYSIAIPLSALFAYAVLIALASWVSSTRWHRREVGLAVPTMRR
ncbi:hypothetical protein GRI58_08835 [Porphyrobacter algicida]|uniref:Metal-dependent hydrolase n=1 Tax=Qipengyuania algicida TaxID=1836209 RepID=A0A845AHJ0_9SPHN|nr:hypothetical protein [Qipengyuania algicida]